MAIFDLFLDESGAFKEGQASLIGGFLCVANQISGNEFGELLEVSKKLITKEICTSYGISDLNFYSWKHCCENRKGDALRYREEIQYNVLKRVVDFLETKEAQPIIFINNSKKMLTDSTTTYLSVLAKGILMLLKTLYSQNEEVELKIHIAQRMDTTARRFNEESIECLEEAIFEHGADNRTIVKAQYRNIFRWFFEMALDEQMYNNWKIDKMISEMEIIEDFHFFSNGVWCVEPNKYTIICDYICNSYYSMQYIFKNLNIRNCVKSFYEKDNVVYKVTSENILYTRDNVNIMLEQGRISSAFEIVCQNEHLESKVVQLIISRINELEVDDAADIIENSMDSLRKFIDNTLSNPENVNKLKNLLSYTKFFKNTLHKTYFEINIRIYLMAVLTHMSKNGEAEENFNKCEFLLDKIEEVDKFDKYSDLIYNRKMVSLVDCFDYESCEELFLKTAIYYEEKLTLRNGKMGKSASYGKIIGTYIQMLAAKIRLAPENKRYEILSEARSYYNQAINYFDAADDISRVYQNCALVEISARNYNNALNYLLLSTCGIAENVTKEIFMSIEKQRLVVQKILSKICTITNKDDQYKLYYYVKIMAECLLYSENNNDNTILSDEMFKCFSNSKAGHIYDEKIKNHPRQVFLWKLGTYYACNGRMKEAIKHYDEAFDQLIQNKEDSTYKMISIAVLAEKVYMVNMKYKDYDKENKLIHKFEKHFEEVISNIPSYMVNIFCEWTDEFNKIKDMKIFDYLELSKKISY